MLADALESVAQEGDPAIEVVAIDDGSTDGTPDLLAEFAARLPMTVVRRRVGNWAANTNYGLELARGEWACVLHQDDYWLPAGWRRSDGSSPLRRVCGCSYIRAGSSARPGPTWACGGARCRPAGRSPRRSCLAGTWCTTSSAFPARCSGGRRPEGRRAGSGAVVHGRLGSVAQAGGRRADGLPEPAVRGVPRPPGVADGGPQPQARRHPLAVGADAGAARRPAARPRVGAGGRGPRRPRSVEVNVGLAAAYHGQPVAWRRLAGAVAALGLFDWHRLLRDSRLGERVAARVRAGFAITPGESPPG